MADTVDPHPLPDPSQADALAAQVAFARALATASPAPGPEDVERARRLYLRRWPEIEPSSHESRFMALFLSVCPRAFAAI